MDDTVDRRRFVRSMASEAAHTAGRLHALTTVAGTMVARGVAGLAEAAESFEPGHAGAPTPPARPAAPVAPKAVVAPAPNAVVAPPSPVAPPAPARLDPTTRETLASAPQVLFAVNRYQVGPFINRYGFHLDGDTVRIETRATSVIAAAVRRDPAVTLLLDEPETGHRVMVFGKARVLEGVALVAAETKPVAASGVEGPPIDPERALIVIDLTHAVRLPA